MAAAKAAKPAANNVKKCAKSTVVPMANAIRPAKKPAKPKEMPIVKKANAARLKLKLPKI
ncbi:MAG TPA: hypothetical protein PKD90_02280 [Phnomibacter sp.]|nr:hypothetical protein [Phnomibacter sp.]